MHRLFVALRPPPDIRRRLTEPMGGVPHARWQDDEQLHVTIRYIGEVDRPTAEDVALALGQVHAASPRVAIAGVGAFDKKGRVDALWAGITPQDDLARLHKKVDQALVRLGLAPEGRAYLPHITLARVPRTAGFGPAIERWIADHAAFSSEIFAFTHLTLYESHLTGEGARYEPVARWALD
ncbi:MAG TPA: RNA 2',3'-cyclic phosphodiesterase [Sphingomonas sp.]